MSTHDLEAHAQNDETVGTVAADWTAPPSNTHGLSGFAKDCGIDTTRYLPFGVEIYVGEPGSMITVEQRTIIEILAFDQTVVGASGESRTEYLAGAGSLPYLRFKTKATLEDALRYIKRLNLILRKYHRGATQFQESELVDL